MRAQRYQRDNNLKFETSVTAITAGVGTVRQINNQTGRSDIAQMLISIEAIKGSIGDESYVFIIQQADDLLFTTGVEYVGSTQLNGSEHKKHGQIAQNIGPITKNFVRPSWIIVGTLPTITFSLSIGGA